MFIYFKKKKKEKKSQNFFFDLFLFSIFFFYFVYMICDSEFEFFSILTEEQKTKRKAFFANCSIQTN